MTKSDIPSRIVRRIIRDIHGRYGLEQEFRSTNPIIQVGIYEEWIYQTALELGMEYKKFEPKNMVEAVNHLGFYFEE
ncbi:hypothetical protein [Virgibacillus dakarensis]|uniref:hypothetical protein n=1 Tax=Virgibacillus dakarensis TaxID=1917889 RepID=UPI000B44B3AE|nr:hypothetical protein [Virgibacillus dakarensis]